MTYSFDFYGSTKFSASYPHPNILNLLPPSHVLISRTPLTMPQLSWDDFLLGCRALKTQINTTKYVFIDAFWDPIKIPSDKLIAFREELKTIFPKSRVVILSANASHFYENLPGVVYVPFFLMLYYGELEFKPRAGRIGCLNRRNAQHRIWLMYHLLSQKLINKKHDVYSVKFQSLHSSDYVDVDRWANVDYVNHWLLTVKPEIATHRDKFPNDYTINHPAWHTGISIITETEPAQYTILCEKTGKGIISKSCFSIYMSETGYRVLEDLGFAPRFFPEHAEGTYIEPILNIARTITTEKQALEYRQMHMAQINHNFEWFAHDRDSPLKSRPWYPRVSLKFKQDLNNL